MADDTWNLALPPYQPEAALLQLARSLRELGLKERSGGFERGGRRLLEVELQPAALAVRLAQRPALTPRFDAMLLKSHADQRKLLDELKKRLARWADED
jgi:hypothetical protein